MARRAQTRFPNRPVKAKTKGRIKTYVEQVAASDKAKGIRTKPGGGAVGFTVTLTPVQFNALYGAPASKKAWKLASRNCDVRVKRTEDDDFQVTAYGQRQAVRKLRRKTSEVQTAHQ